MIAKIVGCCRWIGKHWAISMAIFLVLAITVTTVVCWNVFGKERREIVPVYLTVTGLGEGKDMTKRELKVEESATISEIFSLEYPEIYEDFQQPLVMNNVFQSFLGVRPAGSKQFYVKIDGTYENILTQAYTFEGCIIEIEYR